MKKYIETAVIAYVGFLIINAIIASLGFGSTIQSIPGNSAVAK